MPWVERVAAHVAAAFWFALGRGDLAIGFVRMMRWTERLMVQWFVSQRHCLPQPFPMVDVAAARTDQHLGAAGMLADVFGSMHRLSSRSLPLLGIVDTRQRCDLAGADAIMLAGAGHAANSVRYRRAGVLLAAVEQALQHATYFWQGATVVCQRDGCEQQGAAHATGTSLALDQAAGEQLRVGLKSLEAGR